MLKIGIDARPLSFLRAGIYRYVNSLITALSEIDNANDYYLISSSGFNIETKNIRFRKKILYWPNYPLIKSIWERSLLGNYINSQKLDIFHGTRYFIPNNAGCKSVVTIHDLAFKRFASFTSKKSARYFDEAVRFSSLKADKLIVPSACTKKDLIELYKCQESKIEVIYEAACESFSPLANEEQKKAFRQSLCLDGPYMLFVGTIEPRKNILNTLKAFVKADLKDYKFVICGEKGWLNKDIFQFVQENNLKERVIFFNSLDDQYLNLLYNCAEFFVFCSMHEGFGLPVLEAMSCAKAVITSNNSSLPEIARDAAILVDPNSVGEIAYAMRELATNMDTRSLFEGRAIERSKSFSCPDAAAKTLSLYKKVAESSLC